MERFGAGQFKGTRSSNSPHYTQRISQIISHHMLHAPARSTFGSSFFKQFDILLISIRGKEEVRVRFFSKCQVVSFCKEENTKLKSCVWLHVLAQSKLWTLCCWPVRRCFLRCAGAAPYGRWTDVRSLRFPSLQLGTRGENRAHPFPTRRGSGYLTGP